MRKAISLGLLAAITALLMSITAARAAPIDDANAAHERGDHAAELGITRQQAAKGEAWAQYALGYWYRHGKGSVLPYDFIEAVKWYRLAAAQGDERAQNDLGDLYASGQGVVQDYTEAYKWWRKAAAQGYVRAQYNLGLRYKGGELVGVARDYTEALKWLRLAAAQGDVSAQSLLGEMYNEGLGVAQDYVRAHMWFNLATRGVRNYNDDVKNRDLAASKMTPRQIEEAKKLARECQARDFKGC